MKSKYFFYISLIFILFGVLIANAAITTYQPHSLIILDYGWDEDEGAWCVYAPIHEQENFIVQVWDANMSACIPNATVVFGTHTGEYNITKTDAYGQAYFRAPTTEEKIERCMLYVSASGFTNTSRITYIHNQGIWKTVCIATSSTVDAAGKTKLFNVSRYWKIEYSYVAKHEDSALCVMVIRPDGDLLSYYLIRGVERSSGTIYCEGAMDDIQLDVFASRINSWYVKVYTHA